MLRLILFWLIRILAVAFFVTNLVYVDSKGLWGVVAVILSILACINLYVWGVFCRETNKKIPSMFLLLRMLQGITVFVWDSLPVAQFGAYLCMDLVFYAIMYYDSRFKFVYIEPQEASKSRIRREN